MAELNSISRMPLFEKQIQVKPNFSLLVFFQLEIKAVEMLAFLQHHFSIHNWLWGCQEATVQAGETFGFTLGCGSGKNSAGFYSFTPGARLEDPGWRPPQTLLMIL